MYLLTILFNLIFTILHAAKFLIGRYLFDRGHALQKKIIGATCCVLELILIKFRLKKS